MRELTNARSVPWVRASTIVTPLPPATRYVLRGGSAVRAAAAAALGLGLSTIACRAVLEGDRAALWLGPDEWLLIAAEFPAGALPGLLTAALASLGHSLVDVSHRQTALAVQGPEAATLLAAGCPLHLDPSAFPVGMCTRTVLAKAEIVLWRTAPEAFRIEVWRSFAAYVSAFLSEAARGLI